MEKPTRAGFCIFFLVLFAAQEVVVQTEAKTCESLADKYRGPCITTASCYDHCQKVEHFLSGRCKRLQCWCTRNC